MNWRVKERCKDCPFNSGGSGLRLRKSLQRGRWAEILHGLRNDGYFHCHNTTEFDEDGEAKNGSGLLCAGAFEWQIKHKGRPGQLARITERIGGKR